MEKSGTDDVMESARANTSERGRTGRRLKIAAVAIAIGLLGAGGIGFAWYYDYGSAYAQVISPLHEDEQLEKMIPNVFWQGMPREDLASYTAGGLLVMDGAAATSSTVIGTIHDWRKWFRPRRTDAIRIEIEFDENDKVIATRWSRITESR